MYCGNCKHFSKDGTCLSPSSHRKEVSYFAPMCKDGNVSLPVGFTTTPTEPLSHTKTCKWCGGTFPVEQFVKNASGYVRVCKTCKAQLMRKAALARKYPKRQEI